MHRRNLSGMRCDLHPRCVRSTLPRTFRLRRRVIHVAASIGAFMQLHEVGHVVLRHDWTSMDTLSSSRMFSKTHPYVKRTGSGLPEYYTTACRSRGCWACQYKARRKLRTRVEKFVRNHVMKAKRAWRFVTLTLPGKWYPVRNASVDTQYQAVRRAFSSWRLKMQRRDRRVHGFYTIELAGGGERAWHAHVHVLMKWKHVDYRELRKLWCESVDRRMRKQLDKWTEGSFTNDEMVVKVDPITSEGIASYCTKVTNYVTKGPDSSLNKAEIGKLLYRRRTTGWLGDYHGSKEKVKLEA